jgi:hypothetical protein
LYGRSTGYDRDEDAVNFALDQLALDRQPRKAALITEVSARIP